VSRAGRSRPDRLLRSAALITLATAPLLSQSEIADALVLAGLVLQGGAVFVILARAGAISLAWSATRQTAGAARETVTRLLDKLPWREGATYLELSSNETTLELGGSHCESYALLDLQTPPASLEEVREEHAAHLRQPPCLV
jgi:hypothetical protein